MAQTEAMPAIEQPRISKPADPCTMVIFGASGDLTRRKLIPAHVRNGPSLRRLKTFDLVGEYAETVGIPFFRALEEELHAEADA